MVTLLTAVELRAIGEVMIQVRKYDDDKDVFSSLTVIGFAEFIRRYDRAGDAQVVGFLISPYNAVNFVLLVASWVSNFGWSCSAHSFSLAGFPGRRGRRSKAPPCRKVSR